MSNTNSPESIQKVSHTDYSFLYFGKPVQWRIRQVQWESDRYFTILCEDAVFLKYFPAGQSKLPDLFQMSRDRFMERSDRLFFRNMIDSCDIA